MSGWENVYHLAKYGYSDLNNIVKHKNKFPEISGMRERKASANKGGYLNLCSMLHKTLNKNYATIVAGD